MTQRTLLAVILLIAGMSAAATPQVVSFAQKASVPKQPDTVAIASDKVIELLILMNTNKNGKISKQEFMKFMSTEFDRLDKGKEGELDVQELRRSNLQFKHTPSLDLGK